MDDNGVVRRAAFDFKNPPDRARVERIGRQTIDRFGRQRDQFAGPEQFRRARHGGVEQRRRVGRQDLRFGFGRSGHAASLL